MSYSSIKLFKICVYTFHTKFCCDLTSICSLRLFVIFETYTLFVHLQYCIVIMFAYICHKLYVPKDGGHFLLITIPSFPYIVLHAEYLIKNVC